jgi:hypothetical protein
MARSLVSFRTFGSLCLLLDRSGVGMDRQRVGKRSIFYIRGIERLQTSLLSVVIFDAPVSATHAAVISGFGTKTWVLVPSVLSFEARQRVDMRSF